MFMNHNLSTDCTFMLTTYHVSLSAARTSISFTTEGFSIRMKENRNTRTSTRKVLKLLIIFVYVFINYSINDMLQELAEREGNVDFRRPQ